MEAPTGDWISLAIVVRKDRLTRIDSMRNREISSFYSQFLALGVLSLLTVTPRISRASDTTDPGAANLVTLIDQHRGWGRMGPPPGGDPFSVENRQRIPWFVTAGAYFPSGNVPVFNGFGGSTNVSGDVGTDFAVGYRFPFESGETRAIFRSSNFNYGSGDFGFGNSHNASIAEFDLDVLGRIKGFYVGIGVAFMNATLSSDFYSVSDNNTETALSFTAGYDISPRWFIEGRGHYTGIPVYSGTSVSFGYRF